MQKPQKSRQILDMLDGLGIPYRLLEHEDVHTMEDLAPIEKALGARFFRNLFLCNRQKTKFYLMLIVGDKPFRTAEVSKKLDVARLSFGEGDKLGEMLGLNPGAVNPLSLMFDRGGEITLVSDREILRDEAVCLHPGANNMSIVMSTSDLFERVIPHMGKSPVWIDVYGE